jgi:hypothetical protein
MPKNPSPSFVEQRINAVVALKHILSLVSPLGSALAKANSPLIVALAKVTTAPIYFRSPRTKFVFQF